MTREEHRALDRRIAQELLGWAAVEYAPGRWTLRAPGPSSVPLHWSGSAAAAWQGCPHFSSSPAVATTVLRALVEREYEWAVEWTPRFAPPGYVAVGPRAQSRTSRQFSTWADFPQVLCEAVLAALGEHR